MRGLDRSREGRVSQRAPLACYFVVPYPLLPWLVRRLSVSGELVREHFFVVSANRRVEPPVGNPGKRLHRSGPASGPAVNEVVERDQAVALWFKAHRFEGLLEHAVASVDVADDEVPSALVPSDSDGRHHSLFNTNPVRLGRTIRTGSSIRSMTDRALTGAAAVR